MKRELNAFGMPKGKRYSKWGRKRYYGKLDWDEWYESVVAPIICKIIGHGKPKQKMYYSLCPRCSRILED